MSVNYATKNGSVSLIIGVVLSLLILSTPELALANSVISTIKVGDGPNEIAFNPKNGNMYVGHDRDYVYVIDAANNTVVKTCTSCC